MGEAVGSAVVGETVSTAASFLANKFEELTGVSDKIQRLEWKVLKIQSAIEESNKYDIENKALRNMQQEFIDAAQEANVLLHEIRNSSSSADPQSSDQVVAVQNPIIAPDSQRSDEAIVVQNAIIVPDSQHSDQAVALQSPIVVGVADTQQLDDVAVQTRRSFLASLFLRIRLTRIRHLSVRPFHVFGGSIRRSMIEAAIVLIMLKTEMTDQIRHYGQDLLLKMREIQRLNRILERVEGISGDISDFLEMLRHQKRKRERRRRYRPYKSFFKLAYLELAQDALGYWWVHVSWVQFLVPKIAALVQTKGEFGLKAAGTKLSGVSRCCLML